MRNSTKNIHVGMDGIDPVYGSVSPPIYTSSTFTFADAQQGARRFAGKEAGMIYSRFTNPTVDALQKRLAALEGADMALATSSGMSAIVLTMLHFLKTGDTVVAHNVIYGGTYEFLSKIAPRYGINTKLIDFKEEGAIEAALDPSVKMIYFETPTNPMLEVVDIKAVVEIAKKHSLMTVVDNTFAPPPNQQPLAMGVDLVIHSLTKYIGGHSDITGGAIIGNKTIMEPLFLQSYIFLGPTMSPFTAYLVMRGMTTLDIRMKQHNLAAQQIAEFLEKHPKIARVHYPGLASHPQHELAKKQMSGYGAVISFELKGGYAAGEKMVNSIKIFSLAVSLGGVESLIEHPASMTHSELSEEDQLKAGISPGLIRISVGLEDVNDLMEALENALATI